MRRMFLAIGCAGLFLTLPQAVHAEQIGTIDKALRSMIPIYDENLKQTGRVKGNVIKKGLAVTGVKGSGYLQITLANAVVYVRRADVRFNGPKTCKQSPEARRTSGGMAAGTPGMRAGAGSGGACVPIKR